MATTTLPRSAQCLAAAQRPTLAQLRLLRRHAVQDIAERAKLAALMQDGLPGASDDAKVRKALLAFALGMFADAEEGLPSDAYGQAVLGLIYHELGEFGDAKDSFTAAAKSIPEAKIELARALLDAGSLDDAEKAIAAAPLARNATSSPPASSTPVATSKPLLMPTKRSWKRIPSMSKAPSSSACCSTASATTKWPSTTT